MKSSIKFDEKLKSDMLSSVFNLNPDAIALTVASDGKFIDCNQEFLNQIGYSRDEVIGSTSLELNLYGPHERRAYVDQIRREGNLYNYELRLRRKDGTFFDILFSARFITVDGEQIILNIGKDITERKKANADIIQLLREKQELNEELDVANEELETTNEELQIANEKLRENNKVYQQFFNNPLNGFALCEIITDGGGKPIDYVYLEVNKAFENLTGIKREYILKRRVTELLPSEESAELIKMYGRVALNDETLQFEHHRPSLNKHFEIFAFSPKKKRFIAFLTDITKRKQAEDALSESKEKYKSILTNLQDAYIQADNEGNIIMASPSAARMFRFDSPQEMIGKSALSFYKNPNDRKYVIEKLKKHGKVEENECKALRKDGTTFLASQNAQYHHDNQGQIQGTETLVRDITEYKKAEKNNQMLANLVESSEDAIFTMSIIGIITSWNKGAEQIYGYSAEEVIGKDISKLAPKHLKEETSELINHVKQGKKIRHYETLRLKKDGKLINVTITLSPLFETSGKMVGISTIARDITKRKGREEKLESTMDELKRSNKELEQFAYVSSHDLQEPIRMVTLYSQLLERRYKDKLDDDADDFIEYIVEGAQRMKQLIDDLLAYSRVTSQAKEFENVNLETVLNTVISNLSVTIDENNATITHDPLPTISADPSQMGQVFQNLITNAIKFHGQKTPEIHISVQKQKYYKECTFAVKDNGIGIDPKHQEQIFEVFKRLHTREEYPGTGIGLSIVKKIINNHGGQIWVESEPGKGTTFYFTIPRLKLNKFLIKTVQLLGSLEIH